MRRRSSGSPAAVEEQGNGILQLLVSSANAGHSPPKFGVSLDRVESSTQSKQTGPKPLSDPSKNLNHHVGVPIDTKPAAVNGSTQTNTNWQPSDHHDETKKDAVASPIIGLSLSDIATLDISGSRSRDGRRQRSPWKISMLTFFTTILGVLSAFLVVYGFFKNVEVSGTRMSYMRPGWMKMDISTEHSRFASKYSVYLYRELMVNEDKKVGGIPVLFIPGNAGSHKQVRPIAAEAAQYYHDFLRGDPALGVTGTRELDWYTCSFNEEFTAFHGQSILEQSEYLNDAVAYILSMYSDPSRAYIDPNRQDPTQVILVGHSMGGIVARTMLVMPNYQANSISTIVTMATPHARPPVSFDAQIMTIYDKINRFWRNSYSQPWANDNPLWHVTLISIAGGGLDTMIPSDSTSLQSLVPETHGFTAFTSTIPRVWTAMDHQAILWDDSWRKVLIRAMYDVIDSNGQIKSRADRIRVFKKWFLTGMEESADRILPGTEPETLLTVDKDSKSILAQGAKIVLRQSGQLHKAHAYLLPIPQENSPTGRSFTLLSDKMPDRPGANGNYEVLLCNLFSSKPGQPATLLTSNLDLSKGGSGFTKLACKNAAVDVIPLPPSTRTSKMPLYVQGEEMEPDFSYLQYDLKHFIGHQFIAVIDKASAPTPGWVVAEFSDNDESHITRQIGLRRLLAFGINIKLPARRPMVMDLNVPALHSSLLSYNLEISNQACAGSGQLFTPMVRQYLSEPHESKYFVNVKQASISLHGIAPFMPPPLKARNINEGLSLQIWTDPTCDSAIDISLKVNILGSFGKLFLRYRTVLGAFPLFVVALVVGKQFRVYDQTGIFIPFSESLDACLRRSLPLALLALSMMSFFFSSSSAAPQPPLMAGMQVNGTTPEIDFNKNDLLLGSQDPFFWFLVPFMGVVCIGVCVLVNYLTLSVTSIACKIVACISARPTWLRHTEKKQSSSPSFNPSSLRRRIITTGVLLILVATFIPYQFAYLVACLVQIATSTRALRLASDLDSNDNYNFSNYSHSIFLLMLWTIPAINLPILLVWVHNLAIQWFTPFSSHHNVLSVMPFILLVETLTSGKMIPRTPSRVRHITSFIFLGIAFYAAVYGVSFAYMLHHFVNFAVAWLVLIHSTISPWSLTRVSAIFDPDNKDPARKIGKAP